jgi:phosphatidylserine decarboxylase
VTVAREGLPFVGIAFVIAAVGVAVAAGRGGALVWTGATILVLLAVWVVVFFRDPERTGARDEHLVISPADGKVVMVTDVDEPEFFRGPATRVSIFMNVFNVHVNRYPVGGSVGYVHYNKGKFFNAAAEKASLENEQMSVGIETGSARVLVRQIAGLIARRIVNHSRTGQHVQQGFRMGMIRFGSRVDVFVPRTSTIRVRLGDKTHAGLTVLAELPTA